MVVLVTGSAEFKSKNNFCKALLKEHPEINYVGIEKYSSVLLRAIQKMEQEIQSAE